MALPPAFTTPQEYFTKSVEFLKDYSWIYQHANTRFIQAGVLEKLPSEFVEFFLKATNEDMNTFPLIHTVDLRLEYANLAEFRSKLKALTPKAACCEEENYAFTAESKKFRKMNSKKLYETLKLAHLIDGLCERSRTIFIDFGAGLGYLSEVLYKSNPNIFMLGFEAKKQKVEAAQKRLQKSMPRAEKTIKYKQELITEASEGFIVATAHEFAEYCHIPHPKMVMVGLHACADLSITAMKLFFRMSNVIKLIIMPCCYHKLQMASTSFVGFPLSENLTNAVKDDAEMNQYFNRPFLRLASQQTAANWSTFSAEEHEAHGKEMFQRAIVEAIIDETEVATKRYKKRRQFENNPFTFATICQEYVLRSKNLNKYIIWEDKHEAKFNEILKRYDGGVKLAEGLVCLQTAMQELCENIVLYDRLCYMREYALKYGFKVNVRFQKLLNEKISPRCYVLIAEKL